MPAPITTTLLVVAYIVSRGDTVASDVITAVALVLAVMFELGTSTVSIPDGEG